MPMPVVNAPGKRAGSSRSVLPALGWTGDTWATRKEIQ
jgi:hypothetical protein